MHTIHFMLQKQTPNELIRKLFENNFFTKVKLFIVRVLEVLVPFFFYLLIYWLPIHRNFECRYKLLTYIPKGISVCANSKQKGEKSIKWHLTIWNKIYGSAVEGVLVLKGNTNRLVKIQHDPNSIIK